MKIAKFSKLERRVGQIASRQARRQLMQVPWERFHKAYEEYIRWQAFALWARAIVELEGCAPSWLKTILRKRCPGFMKEVARSNKPDLLGLQLLPWIHNQVFRFAKEEGWLDALVFYGFRDTRSQGYWAYWEHCETEWRKRRPVPLPALVEWMHSALSWKIQGDVRCAAVAKAVENYLDFETILYWLRPLYGGAKFQLPAHVALELRQESPRLLEFINKETSGAYGDTSKSWRRLFTSRKSHVQSDAKKEGWRDYVLRQAGIHPRHVRLADYAALWCKSWLGNAALHYPSLRQWQREMEDYVRASRK
jgi:hypothetical protein